MKPLMIWLTSPLDPRVTIRPRGHAHALERLGLAPGHIGYATTSANTQSSRSRKRRVGSAVSG